MKVVIFAGGLGAREARQKTIECYQAKGKASTVNSQIFEYLNVLNEF